MVFIGTKSVVVGPASIVVDKTWLIACCMRLEQPPCFILGKFVPLSM